MKSNWFLYNKRKNVNEISQKFGITALTSVILCNRDINTESEVEMILSNDLNDLNDESLLPDIDIACETLNKYIKDKKSIRIVGDYDIDGVCATYILYDALKNIGAKVSYSIPDRIQDGYGINISIIDQAIDDKVDLIITCDNGIAAVDQISYAKNNNIEVIVTDHHDVGDLPKDAIAIVDPKRDDIDNKYPFNGICGAVVAWKFIMRYYDLYENNRDLILKKYIDFAMIATIGDIMPLKNENHIIAKIGLKNVLDTKNKGLKKLFDISSVDFKGKGVSTYHIGFIIGPLINAAGRMDKATLALKLFISDDDEEITNIAMTLKKLNDERKKMTEDGTIYAIDEIENKYKNDKVLVVFVNELGEQVAGIVAGRIKEKYNKPAIILTNTNVENEAKASCRSIDAYDIFEALNKHKDLFLKFGGHKLAAGFSILNENIEKLRHYLNNECDLEEDDFIPKVHIDAEYPISEFSVPLIEEIVKLEPYGQDFKSPCFATKGVDLTIRNVYGKDNNVIQLAISKNGKTVKGVYFGDLEEIKERLEKGQNVDIIYTPKINEFNGNRSVEATINNYR